MPLSAPAKAAVGLCAAVLVTDKFVSVARIHGESMQPTLESNDVVLLDKTVPSVVRVERGDIVVLRSMTYPKERMVKRVIGIGRDTITRQRSSRGIGVMVTLKPGRLWVEGDTKKKGASVDSNSFGQVPEAMVEGKVQGILWPPSRWAWFSSSAQKSSVTKLINERQK